MPHLPPQILLVQVCRAAGSPQGSSFPEMNTCRDIHDGDFALSWLEEPLFALSLIFLAEQSKLGTTEGLPGSAP